MAEIEWQEDRWGDPWCRVPGTLIRFSPEGELIADEPLDQFELRVFWEELDDYERQQLLCIWEELPKDLKQKLVEEAHVPVGGG